MNLTLLQRTTAVVVLSLASMSWADVIHASDRGGPAATGVFAAQPVREPPKLAWRMRGGFRDWGPLARVGGMIVAGHVNDTGGLRAIDERTGKLRWLAANRAMSSATPASDGKLVVVAFSNPAGIVAYTLAGKEVWRNPIEPAPDAEPVWAGDTVYVLGTAGVFHALDAQTGRERWHFQYGMYKSRCASRPVVADGVVYFAAGAGEMREPTEHYRLWAVDASTGALRWFHEVKTRHILFGMCLRQPVLAGDTIYGAGETHLLAIDRHTGSERWIVPVEATINGEKEADEVHGLVYADGLLWGMTPRYVAAFDPRDGHSVWRLPGLHYTGGQPPMAVAGDVLYFQGDVGGAPNLEHYGGGTINALDMKTRRVLWSYADPNAPSWGLGDVLPVDGALYLTGSGVVIKLQAP